MPTTAGAITKTTPTPYKPKPIEDSGDDIVIVVVNKPETLPQTGLMNNYAIPAAAGLFLFLCGYISTFIKHDKKKKTH
jgi:LPXTG-motif cell wall-anchored protein